MLKRMIVLTLVTMVLQIKAYEPTANNTFIDEHFIKDSVLVMVSGAVYGSVIEAICYIQTLPRQNQAFYCKTFAAESLAFINVLREQQPVWTLAACRKLNLLFVAIASGYIGSTQLGSATIRTVLASVFYYQLSRISTDSAAYYFWKPDLDNLKHVLNGYVVFNGFSIGLLIGGLIQWHWQNLEERLKLMVLTLASTSTALLSTVFYMRLIEPEEQYSILERVIAVAATATATGAVAFAFTLAGDDTLAVIGAVVGAVAGAGAEVIAKIAAEDVAGALTFAGVGVGVGVIAGAGAGAGHLIIITTRFLLQRLSNGEQPHSINRSLGQVALVSVPFLVTSWLISVNQWVMNNVPVHETMKGIYYPDTARAFFSGKWIEELYHLVWLIE